LNQSFQTSLYAMNSQSQQARSEISGGALASRRSVLQCALLLAGGWGGSLAAQTAYPQRPIKFIVPFAAGGSADMVARLLSERLGLALGQSVIVDNRGGNGSVLGTEIAAKATPDGYTVLLSNGAAMTTGPLMGQITNYKPLSDFVHLNLFGTFTNALIVRADHPAKNVQDLLNMIRLQPGKINYGSAGVGSAGNLTGELLKQLAKIQMVHIPYKGSGPAFNDLMGGQIDFMFNALIASAPHIKAGRVRALALTGHHRDTEFSQVPTLSESVPGAVGDAWFGLSVPAKTPVLVQERLRADMARILGQPEMRAKLAELGMQPLGLDQPEFQTFLDQEIKKWGPVITAGQLKAQ
jgi:tripartite-type tricarboxylate transporter receptor subunit TctC